MKFLSLILSVLYAALLTAQVKDTLYFDKDWNKSNPKDFSFYRIITHVPGRYNVEDYYRSGRIQMQGSFTSLSPKEIEDGRFSYYAENGIKTRDEIFKEGLNEGEYVSFDTMGHMLLKMNFRHDKWDGHRTEYYPSGVVRRDEVYTSGVFITGQCYDETGKEIKFFPLEELPVYPGGEIMLMAFIRCHLVYPKAAIAAGIEGMVKVQCVIDSTGKVTDVAIYKSDNPKLNDAAMDVVRQLPPFTPAKKEGVPVKCPYLLPVTFRLADQGK